MIVERGSSNVLKVPCDLVQTDPPNFRHRSLSVGCGKTSYTENDIQKATPRKIRPVCQIYPKLALALFAPWTSAVPPESEVDCTAREAELFQTISLPPLERID